MSGMSERISTAETAKLIRKALKRDFPGIKFYVRSDVYSGGSSIDIYWLDGPTEKQVEQITNSYNGSGFDGSIDLKYYVDHWLLPDGTIQVANSQGTSRSGGYYEPISNPKPHPEARLVHFSSDHVFCYRNFHVETIKKLIQTIHEKTGEPIPQIIERTWWVAGKERPEKVGEMSYHNFNVLDAYHRELGKVGVA